MFDFYFIHFIVQRTDTHIFQTNQQRYALLLSFAIINMLLKHKQKKTLTTINARVSPSLSVHSMEREIYYPCNLIVITCVCTHTHSNISSKHLLRDKSLCCASTYRHRWVWFKPQKFVFFLLFSTVSHSFFPPASPFLNEMAMKNCLKIVWNRVHYLFAQLKNRHSFLFSRCKYLQEQTSAPVFLSFTLFIPLWWFLSFNIRRAHDFFLHKVMIFFSIRDFFFFILSLQISPLVFSRHWMKCFSLSLSEIFIFGGIGLLTEIPVFRMKKKRKKNTERNERKNYCCYFTHPEFCI